MRNFRMRRLQRQRRSKIKPLLDSLQRFTFIVRARLAVVHVTNRPLAVGVTMGVVKLVVVIMLEYNAWALSTSMGHEGVRSSFAGKDNE